VSGEEPRVLLPRGGRGPVVRGVLARIPLLAHGRPITGCCAEPEPKTTGVGAGSVALDRCGVRPFTDRHYAPCPAATTNTYC
jgi:hypothetical protein